MTATTSNITGANNASATRDRWIALLGVVNKRWQANAAARRELESLGIDPRRFLEHYRSYS